jgi:peptidoglycan/LPS O-acetylase OafA/YrhL
MTKGTFYAPYIDGLRAVAVLSVIVYHLNGAWLPGGFAGVDVFFVISGFVVSTSMHKMQSRGPLSFMANFYARRVTRIVPALVVCLVATAIASALFIPSAYLSDSNQRTGQAAFFGLANIVLARRSGDYFAPMAEFNPYTHTWSLGVEEQFYFIFPMLFFAWAAGRRHLSTAFFAIALVASLAVASWLAAVSQIYAFYMIWSRFWELAAGVLLFQAMALKGHSFDTGSPSSRFADFGALASIAVLLVGLATAQAGTAPMPASLLPVLGTVGVLGFLHGRRGGLVQQFLSLPWMRFIGRISYSLYLWHWPVFVLFRWTSGLESWQARALALLLTAGLSLLSYRFVETPTRRMGSRVHRFVAIGTGIALVLVGVSTSLLIDKAQPMLSLSTVATHRAAWYVDWKSANANEPQCAVESESVEAHGVSLWRLRRQPCAEQPTIDRTVYVVGDSQAGAYAGMLSQFVRDTGAQVEIHTRAGCPMLSLGLEQEREPSCARHIDSVVASLRERMKSGDVVFLPSLRLPRFADLASEADEVTVRNAVWSDAASRARAVAEAAAGPLLSTFTQIGVTVILEQPKPILKINPYRCSDWFNRSNPSCARGESVSRALIEDLRKPIVESFTRLAAVDPAVRLWDPLPELCPQPSCGARLNGEPIFFDGDHLSGYANELLLKSFSRLVGDLPPKGS